MTCSYETALIRKLSILTDRISTHSAALESSVLFLADTEDIGIQAELIRDKILVKMSELREACDEAETLTAKSYWPYPAYSELLFSVK